MNSQKDSPRTGLSYDPDDHTNREWCEEHGENYNELNAEEDDESDRPQTPI